MLHQKKIQFFFFSHYQRETYISLDGIFHKPLQQEAAYSQEYSIAKLRQWSFKNPHIK